MTRYLDMQGLNWLEENKATAKATANYIEMWLRNTSGKDIENENPIIKYIARQHQEIIRLKNELKISERNKEHYKSALDKHNKYFSKELGVHHSAYDIKPNITTEKSKLNADIEATVDDAITHLEDSLYEPSERGAGYAVSDEGMENAQVEIYDFLNKNKNES